MLFAMLAAFCVTSWAASEKVLYRFHGKDGWSPNTVILGSDGALYGTTAVGGANSCLGQGCGVVFKLARGADGKWRETVLHNFAGSDGQGPVGPLVFDNGGNLYGATVYGGPSCSQLGCGVVFELVRGDGNKWTFKVLHDFAVTDGANPYAGLIFDSKGNLYGTTSYGGNTNACTGGCGVVFELAPDGKGNWAETVLHEFAGEDGVGPVAPLLFDSAGSLYGTTQYGGDHASGTVFRLSPGKGDHWTEEVLHSFGFETNDGDEPTYGVIFGRSGNLYGTTLFGGTKNDPGGGTAFRLMPEAGGKWKEKILHSFNRARFGGGPVSSGLLMDKHGSLYGTTGEGGRLTCPGTGGAGCGVVFRLAPAANGKWTETVLHAFGGGDDGDGPGGGLVFSSSGDIFGVTGAGGYAGGVCAGEYFPGCGVVFEVVP